MINGIIGSVGLDPKSFDPREKNPIIRPPPELAPVQEPDVRSVPDPGNIQPKEKSRLDTFA